MSSGFPTPDFQMIRDDIESQKKQIALTEKMLKNEKTGLKRKQQILKRLQKKWAPENKERLVKQIQKEFSN